MQHLLDGSLQLTNIENGGARGLSGGVHGVSGAFFCTYRSPKSLFFLVHLKDSFKKTPELGEEKSAEEKRGEERRGEERRGLERREVER